MNILFCMKPMRQTAINVESQWLSDIARTMTSAGMATDDKHVQAFSKLGIVLSSARMAGMGRPSERNLSVATNGGCSAISPPVIELTS